MGERKMYNFPFVEDGQTYWRSRSCTTVGFVFCFDKEGFVCILANQRGPGAADNFSKWNVPCGYIDFSETGIECVSRETYEETGVKIKPEKFNFDTVTFSENNDQNINLRYWTKLDGTIDDYPLSNVANEENETSDIQWIRVKDIDDYEWAFGHEKAIPEMCHKYVDFYLDDEHIQRATMFLVNLDITMQKHGKTVSSETLTICETREKCKEFTESHIQMMKNTYAKNGDITLEMPYNSTDIDAIVKWSDKNGSWFFWYNFIPVKKYE